MQTMPASEPVLAATAMNSRGRNTIGEATRTTREDSIVGNANRLMVCATSSELECLQASVLAPCEGANMLWTATLPEPYDGQHLSR